MSVEQVQEYFEGTPLEGGVIICKESSATVELAAAALGCESDKIAKTLSFMVGENPILIVVSGKSKVDNRKYKDTFETKAKMIPYEEVEALVGDAPGGVCPFAVKDGVKVYLDESLKKYEEVYPAAGSSNSAIRISIEQLEEYTDYVAWVDVCKPMEEV